jgi:hypothetical protein
VAGPQARDDWRGLFAALVVAHRIFDGVPHLRLETTKNGTIPIARVSISCAGGG